VTGDFDIELARIPDPFAREAGEVLPPCAALARPESPSRSRRRAVAVAAACGAVLYDAVALAFFKTRPDLATASTPLLALELAVPLGVGALALAGAARTGRIGLGEPAGKLAAWVIGAPLLFALVTLAAFPHDVADGAFWSRTQTCFLVTALLGAGPLTLAAFALRSSFAAAAGWRTAAIGIASGALAASSIALVCPDGGAFHVLVGHGAMMLVMGLFSAALVRSTTRI
jgi:hypothetical protein